MSKQIHDHRITPAGNELDIKILETPQNGNASVTHTDYLVEGGNVDPLMIQFQNGPIGDHGVNGITEGVLLAIVVDRLRRHQAGPFACRENDLALANIEQGLHWLHQRTLDRMRRGVEGKNIK
jgi:hypothetical protein